ncbi:LRR receptor-like serine/threonine-protein kinase GSO1 [Morus notabilis]|uniref:LRR receptor-like serine/threonine-protein kinase GSO1 n=1 Tax=Morus notabilis TaxID=981085 RepID=W9SHE5_9ROSA|nr:receptor-like protein EIX2 [Morus notabilis]EXC29911.1 LRR receptor-like serine/threonine-protein kinase GSO1 [Morus notabilis]
MLPTSGWSLKLPRAIFLVLLLQIQLVFGLVNTKVGDPQIRCIDKERQALVSLFQSSSSNWLPWLTEEDCCKWEGVHCSNQTNHVIAIHIPPQQVIGYSLAQGAINRSLIELQQLESLNLSSNYIRQIPPFLGFLGNLRYLDLSNTDVSGAIPTELGNLFNIKYLDLSGNSYAQVQNLKWLSNLSSLEYLDLSLLNLSKSHDWLQTINGLPKLRTLRLGGCVLPAPTVSSLSHTSYSNSQPILEEIDLHGNYLTSSIFPWLFSHSSTKIFYLNVSNNQLNGVIPEAFGNMNLLQFLDLSNNQLEGGIPKSFGNLCSLRELYLMGNRISGQLDTFIETLSKCSRNSSVSLSPSSNETMELFLNSTRLSLKVLDLGNNYLSGTVPEVIGNFTELEVFHVGENSLKGVISESHFSKLSKLRYLDLSSNSLLLNFTDDWVPPFQLDTIKASSLNLGRRFPKWIQTQNNYSELDISNASISGTIPTWLWTLLSSKSCRINLSHNQLSGRLPNLSIDLPSLPELNLSSNQLEGPIPSFLSNVKSLDLSNNNLSGPISFLCTGRSLPEITFVDLSNNQLSGELPDCWGLFRYLVILDVANNNLSGKIPASMGALGNIQALQLRNNKFFGELPASWFCPKLQVLDLGGNEISGPVPEWIGDGFPDFLIVLSLRSNNFSGSIPSKLCHLAYIQLFDLSGNNISGEIPKCLNNLTALTERSQKPNMTIRIPYTSGLGSEGVYKSTFDAESSVNWQRKVYEYKNILGLLKCIDLSNNALAGQIPEEITHLAGLVSLNLSWNSLTGQIPRDIGDLKELTTLDLSRNRLYGQIPPSLSQIDFLALLNLSNNNLTGRIPKGTQLGLDAAFYAGNPGLCGFPLEECEAPEPEGSTRNEQGDEEDSFITQGFYFSTGLGYAVGIWVVIGTLIFSDSWRFKYLKFLSDIYDWLYVMILLNKAKLERMLKT